MCGLFGMFHTPGTAFDAQAVQTCLRSLAIHNQSRGDDSTGLAVFDGAQVTLTKDVLPAVQFVDLYDEVFSTITANTPWVVGHTRAATVGAVNADNAHPFLMGDLLGAHNGGISNHATLNTTRDYELHGCDSERFFAYADEHGLKRAIKESDGWLALTVIERPFDTLQLYRDSTSQLYAAYVQRWKLLVWSSELFALEGSLLASGIRDYTMLGIEPHRIYRIMPDGLQEKVNYTMEKVRPKDYPLATIAAGTTSTTRGTGFSPYFWCQDTQCRVQNCLSIAHYRSRRIYRQRLRGEFNTHASWVDEDEEALMDLSADTPASDMSKCPRCEDLSYFEYPAIGNTKSLKTCHGCGYTEDVDDAPAQKGQSRHA